jgi:hypothetical protein
MFKKEKTQEADAPESPKKVEDTAYEDSWYRSLKALAEREPNEDDETVEGPED